MFYILIGAICVFFGIILLIAADKALLYIETSKKQKTRQKSKIKDVEEHEAPLPEEIFKMAKEQSPETIKNRQDFESAFNFELAPKFGNAAAELKEYSEALSAGAMTMEEAQKMATPYNYYHEVGEELKVGFFNYTEREPTEQEKKETEEHLENMEEQMKKLEDYARQKSETAAIHEMAQKPEKQRTDLENDLVHAESQGMEIKANKYFTDPADTEPAKYIIEVIYKLDTPYFKENVTYYYHTNGDYEDPYYKNEIKKLFEVTE